MLDCGQIPAGRSRLVRVPADGCARFDRSNKLPLRLAALLLPGALLALAGCAGGVVTADPGGTSFSVTPGTSVIDTNCTGCNVISKHGAPVQQFRTSLPADEMTGVTWSVSGGDARSGAGTISTSGEYAPPSYLTADRVQVVVTATLSSGTTATSVLTVTPGFLQPLTPENSALGANGQVTVTGILAEAGGQSEISFTLANSATGSSGGQGTLGPTTCQRPVQTFTQCSVTYTAPPTIAATGVTYVVATAGNSTSKTAADLLLNTAGVASNPASHQAEQLSPAQLGSSGSNNSDYDTQGAQVADCCGGTLGALIQDGNGRQYLLSNNHVLARSDQASVGDSIVQPGLIDNNCTPYGDGPGITPVASLTGWLPLSAAATNADAAIAQVAPSAVDGTGSILELGVRQADGTLSAAPPGTSSTGGKGESAGLGMMVAKSGRTTGLTCASVSAIDLDVNVDYFTDCAETKPYLSKTFTNQIAVSGNQFSDAGDSGSLMVDTTNAEPVGLFFAGGVDAAGVSEGVANPVGDVLSELSTQVGAGTSYSFVGAVDHGVSCLTYGDSTVALAQSHALSDAEMVRAQLALARARLLVNPATGVLGVATGKSSDHAGESAILVYVEEGSTATLPATVDGVRTLVIATNAHAVAAGSAPQTPFEGSASAAQNLPAAALIQAIAIKQREARNLMAQNAAFFGVGVGQSLDNPREAALVIYVDRKKAPAQLPETLGGLRTRYVLMDRLHVTRSYATPVEPRLHCMPRAMSAPENFDPLSLTRPENLNLN